MAEAPRCDQRSRRMFVAGATLFTMLLASCSGVVPRGGRPAPAAPKPQAQSEIAPQDQPRHRVAVLVPLSGPNASVGQSIANAASMALIDTSNRSIRLTTYDTATGAAAAAKRALADGNRLFLGPLLSQDVAAVAAEARNASVPVVAYSNDTSVVGDGVYLMGFSPNQSVDRVVRYAKGRGITKFAALVPAGVYGRNASTAMIRAVESAGGSLVAMKSYDRSPKSLGVAVAQLGKGQPYDAVLVADNARIATQAVPLVRKATSPQARVMGTELWQAESGLLTSPILAGSWFASVSDKRYRQLAVGYKRQFGRAPFRLASLGYDSMLLVIKATGSWKVGDRFPANMLRDPDGFVGVDGAFRFGPTGIAERALEVQELSPAGVKTVSEAPASFKQ
ncbi:penicillin-binding protein activator [Sphingomonas montanisoli]|uniref:Penicillin-binding protein activator n=1 Tax=Sphingomonas montanisoli TaxID=2606412 RepID=A0A5D9CBK0_9SPHN|nr:penicillin-binding protein activator [Sphingomonas montanisoli]TZG28677.1 penicillin-binding protein activator [Sphingomonas montanisoli]